MYVLRLCLISNFFKPLCTFDPQARRRLGAELKPRVTTPVEYMYNFETGQAPESIIYNTSRAQELLRNMNFIHPVRPTSCIISRVLIEAHHN